MNFIKTDFVGLCGVGIVTPAFMFIYRILSIMSYSSRVLLLFIIHLVTSDQWNWTIYIIYLLIISVYIYSNIYIYYSYISHILYSSCTNHIVVHTDTYSHTCALMLLRRWRVLRRYEQRIILHAYNHYTHTE